MHRGVQAFITWVEANPDFPGVRMNPPAQAADLTRLEQQLGAPLPADLRLVLSRFNGGNTPSGQLLSVTESDTPPGAHSVEAHMTSLAERLGRKPWDRELLLPFFQSDDGGLLAFERSAAPLSDTWPIVDYHAQTGDLRLVYRTFDGWCRHLVSEWSAPDFAEDFSVDRYLHQGQRHAFIEADVSTAHATVAHALRRAGEPERALNSYLEAARCLPALPWCDWEALKLAACLGRDDAALEAATRLCARAPRTRWRERETVPARAADVIATVAARTPDRDAWLRLLDQLDEQAMTPEERCHVQAVRHAVFTHQSPPTRPSQLETWLRISDADARWQALCAAYTRGELRDEDILLDPALAELREAGSLRALLRIRREF